MLGQGTHAEAAARHALAVWSLFAGWPDAEERLTAAVQAWETHDHAPRALHLRAVARALRGDVDGALAAFRALSAQVLQAWPLVDARRTPTWAGCSRPEASGSRPGSPSSGRSGSVVPTAATRWRCWALRSSTSRKGAWRR